MNPGRRLLQSEEHLLTCRIYPNLDVFKNLEHECFQVWREACAVHFYEGITFSDLSGLFLDVFNLGLSELFLQLESFFSNLVFIPNLLGKLDLC